MVLRLKALFQAALWLCLWTVLSRALNTPCETDWIFSREAGKCVKIYDEQKSWWDALRSCQSDGAELVLAGKAKVFEFVKDLLTLMRPSLSSLYVNKRQVNDYLWITKIEENEDENTHPSYKCGVVSDRSHIIYVPCSTNRNYICEKKPDLGFCPDQWITSLPSGTCIRIFSGNNKSTWADARDMCQSENGDLVTIPDKDTNEFIGMQLTVLNEKYAYIGLNDQLKEGTFQWLDYKDEVEFFNWAQNQPRQLHPQQDCTLTEDLGSGYFAWVITFCDLKWAFVCEMFSDCENEKYGMMCPIDCGSTNCAKQACNPRTGVCQEGCNLGFNGSKCDVAAGFCPDQWIPSAPSGTCIRIFSGNKSTWADAREICQSENGDLVTILDKDTNELIGKQLLVLNEKYAYIGLNDQQKEGTFQWLDYNDRVEFFNWAQNGTGQSTPQQDCTVIATRASGDFPWAIHDCDQKQAFVCEMFSDCENEQYGMLCPTDCGSTNCAKQACNPRTGVCKEGCKLGFAGSKCDVAAGFCPDKWITSAPSGTCIRLFTGNKSTWADARKICQSDNGDLVTILDKDMNELIGNQLEVLNEKKAYIGLNDQNQEGTFKWLDFNDMVEFSIWHSNQPDKSTPQKDCTLIQTGTKGVKNSWVTADCDQQHAFVCEMFADCENEKYGMMCPIDCGSTNCAKEACNPRTGVCQEGCKSGFTGSKCDVSGDGLDFALIGLVVAVLAILIGASAFLIKHKLASVVKTKGQDKGETKCEERVETETRKTLERKASVISDRSTSV